MTSFCSLFMSLAVKQLKSSELLSRQNKTAAGENIFLFAKSVQISTYKLLLSIVILSLLTHYKHFNTFTVSGHINEYHRVQGRLFGQIFTYKLVQFYFI